VTASEPAGVIAFAERVLEVLDEGRYTTSYEYAVLLALIDLCLERTQQSGAPPHVIYWPHTLPFAGRAASRLLVQSRSARSSGSSSRCRCPTCR